MRNIIYVAHPVRGDILANLANVKAWLRDLFHRDPDNIYIAPWVAEVEAFEESGNPADPAVVTKALEDDVAVVKRCDGILLVGGKVSSGMKLEHDAALEAGNKIVDWSCYRTPSDVPPEFIPAWGV